MGTMNAADKTRWLERYSDYYDTDDEREAGYLDYVRNRSELNAVFDLPAQG